MIVSAAWMGMMRGDAFMMWRWLRKGIVLTNCRRTYPHTRLWAAAAAWCGHWHDARGSVSCSRQAPVLSLSSPVSPKPDLVQCTAMLTSDTAVWHHHDHQLPCCHHQERACQWWHPRGGHTFSLYSSGPHWCRGQDIHLISGYSYQVSRA